LTIQYRGPNGRLELVGSGNSTTVDLDAIAEPQSKFWIGVGCEPATDALKAQLGLGEKPALLITMVADESPAKTAGIQLHDVLTTAKLGDESQALDSVATLTAMVMKAEQKQALVLTVIRQAKSQEISVTPAERPQPENHADLSLIFTDLDVDGAISFVNRPQADVGNLKRVRLLLKELQAAVGEQPPAQDILVTGPVVAPPIAVPPLNVPHIVVMTKPDLPENVTVTITKKGTEPIRIQYQEGEGKSWGATENELGTLPPAGRNAVQATLRWLQQKEQPMPAAINLWGQPHAGGHIVTWPVPHVLHHNKGETGKGPASNNHGDVTARVRKTVTATATPAPPQDAAARLQAMEKKFEALQKQQQDLMTKQQEALRKDLQSLRDALEKAEKK